MIKINKGFMIDEVENYAKQANKRLCSDDNLIDCSLGINPFGISKKISSYLYDFNVETINMYPKSNNLLKEIISNYWSDITILDNIQIHFTHGGMGACELVNKILLNNQSNVLGYCPQFTDYIFDVEKCGANFNHVNLEIENNFKFDANKFIDSIHEGYDVIFIDNPNNPTGQIIDICSIEKIIKKANELNIAVILDEVYGDYMDKNNSAISLVNTYDNLFIIRSFSKAFGIASLRVGYVILPKILSKYFEKVLIAFPINSIGQHFVKYIFDDQEFLIDSIKTIKEYKKQIVEKVKNLIILETDIALPIMTVMHPDKEVNLFQMFLEEGILTSSCRSYIGLGENSIRLRIPKNIQSVLLAIENIENNISKS